MREIKKVVKKSDVPSAAELLSGLPPLESVKTLLSLFVSHSREEAKGNRTFAMFDIGRAYFRGVPERRVFVELPDGRVELEADTRHVATVLRYQKLEKSTPVVTPVARRPTSEEFLLLPGSKLVNAEDTTLCRSVTMRVNCLSLDRPDLSFAAGSLGTRGRVPRRKTSRNSDVLGAT